MQFQRPAGKLCTVYFWRRCRSSTLVSVVLSISWRSVIAHIAVDSHSGQHSWLTYNTIVRIRLRQVSSVQWQKAAEIGMTQVSRCSMTVPAFDLDLWPPWLTTRLSKTPQQWVFPSSGHGLRWLIISVDPPPASKLTKVFVSRWKQLSLSWQSPLFPGDALKQTKSFVTGRKQVTHHKLTTTFVHEATGWSLSWQRSLFPGENSCP